MTDYIQMARTAAASKGHTLKDIPEPETVEFLQAFAELVRNAALEEAAKVCDPTNMELDQGDDASTGIYRCVDAIRALMKEKA